MQASFSCHRQTTERYNLKVSQTNFSKGGASLIGGGGVLVITFSSIGNESGVHVKLEHAASQNFATLVGAGICLRLYGGKVNVDIENMVANKRWNFSKRNFKENEQTVVKDGISSKRSGAGVCTHIGYYTYSKISFKLQDVLLKNSFGSHRGEFALSTLQEFTCSAKQAV